MTVEQKIDQFWNRISVSGPNDCWPWDYTTKDNPYGQFRILGRDHPPARIAYQLVYGVDLGRFELVCHTCDNPPCCNPDHLFLGSDLDNNRDMVRKGREFHPVGESHPRSKFQAKKVLRIRELYDTGNYSLVELGKLFGTSDSQISQIVKRKVWRHI